MTGALDRPVWNMLRGRQAMLASACGAAVRLDPGYGPFAAAADRSREALADLSGLVPPGEEVWLVETEEWPAPDGMAVQRTARLVQMVADAPEPGGEADDIELLDAADAEAMTALALATKPGPWAANTRLYGDFYGVRRDGRLAAMAGERMLPAEGLAEVSGVCTWPEFRGQGLAARLMRRVMAGFAARGDRPFLHTYADNHGAIGLYERLGFSLRREMVVTVLARA